MQRIWHAGNKNGQFVMVDAATGDTLLACHNTKSYAYDVFLHTTLAGEALAFTVPKTTFLFTSYMQCPAQISHMLVS